MDATYEGWAPDPFDAHEVRYFVDGFPTKLVRDGSVEEFDDLPPRWTWPAHLQTPRLTEATAEQPAEPAVPDDTTVPDEPVMEQPVEPAVPDEPVMEQPVESAVPDEPVMEEPVEPAIPDEPVMEEPVELAVPDEPVMEEPVELAVPDEPVMKEPVEPAAAMMMQSPLPPPPPPLPPGASFWTPPPAPGVVSPQPDVTGAGDTFWGQGPGEPPGFGPAHDDTFVGGVEPSQARRPRKRLVAGLAALVVVAAVAGVLVVVSGGKSAEAAVIDSVNSTLADRTAHVGMEVTVHSPSSNVTESGTGGIDFSQNALQLQFNVDEAGQKIPLTALYIGGSVYESIAGLDQLVPGKSWISIDLGSLATSSQSSSAFGTGNNPTAMLRLLAEQGNTVVPLGPSSIDGTAVQGYSVTLNVQRIKSQLAHANLPSWMTSALSQVDIESVTNTVYVDGNGLLRRYSVSLTENVTSTGKITLDESLDFSDYGAAVTVSAPPAAQVMTFEQFLQAAEAAGTNSPS